MSVTQKELARRLNVSQVTVSRALRGSKGVSEDLRRSIRAQADELGYSIDASNYEARLMRHRACGQEPATNVVCVILDLENDSGEHSFNGRIFHGLSSEAEAMGLETVMAGGFGGSLPLLVTRRQVDGVVCLPGDVAERQREMGWPVPCVSMFYGMPEADLVTVDNQRGARLVGDHLCRHGHRRIAFIGPDTELARERLKGLREAARTAGADVPDELVRLRPFVSGPVGTTELVHEIFDPYQERRRELPFTALVAYNDHMAAVTIHVLREAGWRIPEELSVAGFDGVWPAKGTDPKITTAAIPLEEVGAEAVRLLVWRLENPGSTRRRTVLEPEFVAGETVGPARNGSDAAPHGPHSHS